MTRTRRKLKQRRFQWTTSGFIFTITLLLSHSPILPYETEWDDPKYKNPDRPTQEEPATDGTEDTPERYLDSWFKVDGALFFGYEFLDESASGEPDAPGSEKSGFVLSRAYLNVRGGADDGPFKGWSYRLTSDLRSDSGNGHDVFVKFLYVDIPLARGGKTSLRLGQQQAPSASSQTGANPVKIWGHRYLAGAGKSPLHQLGLTDTADRGIGLIHKADYFGAHLLLANGEGYKSPNALALGTNNLNTLAQGTGDSYGYHLYGMLSLIPTGKNRSLQWNINLPFIEQNIIGMHQSEVSYSTMDVSNPANPQWQYFEGQKRAKRDAVRAIDSNIIFTFPGFEVTAGGGYATYHDRRGQSYLIDETVIGGVSPADLNTINNHVVIEEDRRGAAKYVYSHFRWKMIGGVIRYMEGTGGDTLSDKVSAIPRNPWLSKLITQDAQDGTFGNLSYSELQRLQDDKGRFNGMVIGATWHANKRFQVTLGVYTVSGRDSSGNEFRENRYDYIDDGAGNTVADQIENNAAIKNSLGIPASEELEVNDFIGKKAKVQQTFIRAQYVF